ncbi:MAG: hypothetical protein OHK93_002517 [Ramalina farinacea]|uniref:Bacteriophage T5 Orf172 DNA-binding domain-containing protein n=1 Tax=Ramalina farinacea TaxID=258253 RepID=A0AA43QRI8_9LECA|nr:hypothetical protein [Ramalina farinacea]
MGKLSDPIRKAVEELDRRRRLDADHTVETPERQKPQGPGLWLFRKLHAREEGITAGQKQDLLADVLPLNSESSPIQPAGVGGSPAILAEQDSNEKDPSKVQSAPTTPALQRSLPREDPHEPLEKALESASSSATPMDPEKVSQNNSTRKIRLMRRKRNDSSPSLPAAITPLGTIPQPFFNDNPANQSQWQQSSSKDSETVKSELISETQTPHQKSSYLTACTSDSEKENGKNGMDQLQHPEFLEAGCMIDRLLGLKYFEGAQSSLDQLSLILRLLQQRDLRTSSKAVLGPQKETAHVQPSLSASVTDTEKLHSGKCSEGATAGPDVKIDRPVGKGLGRRSSNPQEPKESSFLPVPSSSRGRSASESAIPTSVKIFSDFPGVPIDVGSIVRYTPSKQDGKIEFSIDFIALEGNRALKRFTSWHLPKKHEGTTLQKHLQQEIQRPIQRDVMVGKPHHGRIYIYWVQGNFGLVKIGFTTQTEEQRLQQWCRRCEHTPHLIELNKAYLDDLPHVHRVERLIHIELRDQRIIEPVCAGCGNPHDEWFIVSNELAKQVTQKWCDWMQQDPYEKIIGTPYKSSEGKERLKEKWTLKQEHLDRLKAGELLFKTGESSSRRSSLLEPFPAPASAPPKLPSRRSQLSPRPQVRKSSSAGRLSGPTQNESFKGRTAAAAISSDLLSPVHTPAPREGRYEFRSTPKRRRRSASQLDSRDRSTFVADAAKPAQNKTTANSSSTLLSPAHTPTPPGGHYNFRNTPERER